MKQTKIVAAIFGLVGLGLGTSMAAGLASVTYDLGPTNSPTIINGESVGFLPWIAKGSLSTGSILRSLSVNATLWVFSPPGAGPVMANNIAAYLDTLPEDPNVGGLLQVGSYWPWNQGMPDNQAFCNYNGRGWANGGGGVGSTVTDTKLAAVWASVCGEVDLGTCQLSVGNYQYTATYSGTMTVQYDGAGNDIVAFGLPGHPGVFTDGNTIALTLPHGTAVNNLAPSFNMSDGATCKKKVGGTPIVSGVTPINFTAPVVFTVTAQDGITTKDYTVTVKCPPSTACDMTAFKANLAGSRATLIGGGPKVGTVVVNVPAGTTAAQLAALTPTLTLSSNATCVIPTPPLSLTAPVHYIVTAQGGSASKDYTVTVTTNASAFRLFVLKTATNGLASADYDYLSLIPASKHVNNGAAAVFAVASTNDFATNTYLQDYLRRYRPTAINTINFSATISNFTSTALTAAGPLELSVYMATNNWASSSRVVLVSDALHATNYPNVLQASALAAALDAPLIYYNANSAKVTLVTNAIARLGATEVIYVNAAGTKPALATLVLTNPVTIVNYLAGKNLKVDYFAATNPQDLSLISGAKLSLTAPFIAARRTGIVVPITSYVPVPNTTELFHYTGYPLIKAELGQLYQALGRYPSYLALVGNATSIPLSYSAPSAGTAGTLGNAPTDFDYANVDADPFADIAIGRIMAYNIFDATLLTSRISTYEQLFDGVWEKTMADVGGQWDSAYQDALGANYVFGSTNLVGLLGPTQPVEASIMGHNDHSSQHVLGGAFSVDSVNVLAPAVIFSEGCSSAAIDFETLVDGSPTATNRGAGLLVVNQLAKLGAVAYLGDTRLSGGPDKMMQSRMVNSLLAGDSLGRGYMAGVDAWSLVGSMETDDRRNWILLGDPGLKIHVPSAPAVAPANQVVTHETTTTDILEVNIPSTLFTPEVDQDWCSWWGLTYPQYWGEKAGIYGMDVDRFYLVRFTPPRAVSSVEELDTWPTVNCKFWGDVKLGLMGPPTIDYQQDGTQQLVWAIRANIMDWTGAGGGTVPLAQMTNDTFRITYDLVPDITSFNANLTGSSASIQSLSATNGTVMVTVPFGTTDAQIAALAPTYMLDLGATCNQPNTAIPSPALSASTPVHYIVTGQDGTTTKDYTVTVTYYGWRYAPWTGDADSGITSASPYTVAVNLGASTVTVNGVAFQASALSGANFSISGGASTYNGGTPNITGNSLALASDFIYDGNPRTVTLNNLMPGKTYETTFFSYGFEASGRTETFASGGASRVVDQDAYGSGNGIRIMYGFVAGSSTKVITITPAAGSVGTFHLCALANRLVSSVPTTTTLALTGGGTPSVVGMPLTFTATVTGSAPAGNVTFYAGVTPLGASALNGSFQASLTTTNLAVGLHQITACYGGDVNNETSVSAAQAIEVNAPILGFVLNGNGTLTLTWTSGRLLEATNVMGPWTTNAATGPTLTVTPDTAVPQRFYRLQRP